MMAVNMPASATPLALRRITFSPAGTPLILSMGVRFAGTWKCTFLHSKVESCVVMGRPMAASLLRCCICCLRSEEHTSELQSLMRISYAVFCLKKKNTITYHNYQYHQIHKPNS